MKRYIFLFFIIFNVFLLNSNQIKSQVSETYFMFGSGISYDFNLSRDIVERNDHAFFDVPLIFELDFRLKSMFSISTGVTLSYSYHMYSLNSFEIEKHNLWIDIPLNIRFYPLAGRELTHYYFYIGTGLFFRAWPVNYYLMSSKNASYSGNAYKPDNEFIQPGDSYMPVNIGAQFMLGNILKINNSLGAGLEISAKYLFAPFINGYMSSSKNNSVNDHVYLNFWGNLGVKIFLHFDLSHEKSDSLR